MFGWCQKSPKTAANEDDNASCWTQGLRLELQDPPTLCWGKCMYRMSVHLPRTLRTRWTVVPIGVSGIVFSSVHYCSWRLLAPPGNHTALGSLVPLDHYLETLKTISARGILAFKWLNSLYVYVVDRTFPTSRGSKKYITSNVHPELRTLRYSLGHSLYKQCPAPVHISTFKLLTFMRGKYWKTSPGGEQYSHSVDASSV